MYDDFTLEYKCRTECCTGFAEYSLFEDSHGNHVADVCAGCEENADGSVTSSLIERGIGDYWEIAEALGWVNPIDTLFKKYGVDNPEDLPEHERHGYESAVDEAEADAIAYIEKNFSDYIVKEESEFRQTVEEIAYQALLLYRDLMEDTLDEDLGSVFEQLRRRVNE